MTKDTLQTVPVEQWGKDHHSLLLYIETRVVDHGGEINDQNMRGHMEGWEKYPTILAGGDLIYGHSDYDCLRDLISEGYVVADTPSGRFMLRWSDGDIKRLGYKVNALTEKGYDLAHRLRIEKAERVVGERARETE